MENGGDFANLGLENSERARIGYHQRGDVVGHQALDFGRLQTSALVGFRDHHFEAGQRGTGRIGTMSGVGNYYFVARPSMLQMVGADDQESRQFTVSAGGRMQRD